MTAIHWHPRLWVLLNRLFITIVCLNNISQRNLSAILALLFTPLNGVAAMKEVAEFVNEDKRRLEDLEMIDAWQNTVENWAVSIKLLYTERVINFLLPLPPLLLRSIYIYIYIYYLTPNCYLQGPNLRDTSRRLMMEGSVTKFSLSSSAKGVRLGCRLYRAILDRG